MPLTNAFHRAVESNNVLRIRIMMKDSLLVDPSFKEFNEMKKAAAGVKGLWDEHDGGKEFITDKSKWNNDYMNEVMVKVVSNFSHERINHLKEVVRYLIPTDKNGKSWDDDSRNKKEPERNVRENVPSKYYKAGESINTNRLQSVINTCNKMMNIIESKLDKSDDNRDISSKLSTIKDILYESSQLMKNLGRGQKDKPKTNNEAIAFQLLDIADSLKYKYLNETFSEIDDLLSDSNLLTESVIDKVKNNNVIKTVVRKIKAMISQLLATLRRISGFNKIQKSGEYIDTDKALSILNKIMSSL